MHFSLEYCYTESLLCEKLLTKAPVIVKKGKGKAAPEEEDEEAELKKLQAEMAM